MEEEEIISIISKLKRGDNHSFNAVILAYEKDVFSLCFSLLKNREEAEEVAQDSFVKAFLKIKSFKGNAKFSTWLYRIAYNNCINKLRSNRKRVHDVEWQEMHDLESSCDHGMKELQTNERKKFVNLALYQLSEHESTLINLYYHNECSLVEMEEIMGISKETLKVQLHRARKRFEIVFSRMLNSEIKSLL